MEVKTVIKENKTQAREIRQTKKQFHCSQSKQKQTDKKTEGSQLNRVQERRAEMMNALLELECEER